MQTFAALMLFVFFALPASLLVISRRLFEEGTLRKGAVASGVMLVEVGAMAGALTWLTTWMQALLPTLVVISVPVFIATLRRIYRSPEALYMHTSVAWWVTASTTVMSLVMYGLVKRLPLDQPARGVFVIGACLGVAALGAMVIEGALQVLAGEWREA